MYDTFTYIKTKKKKNSKPIYLKTKEKYPCPFKSLFLIYF